MKLVDKLASSLSCLSSSHCKLPFYRMLKQYLLLLSIIQMASGLFLFIAALGRNMIIANTFGSFALLAVMTLGGFIVSRGIVHSTVRSFW